MLHRSDADLTASTTLDASTPRADIEAISNNLMVEPALGEIV